MIDTIVRYLCGAHVPFRLSSYPSEESLPKLAHRTPHEAMLVSTELVLVDGRIVIACFPSSESIDYAALGAMLGGMAVPASMSDLPGEFASARGPVPPLGQLFGVTTVMDQSVVCSVIEFQVFDRNDFIDIPWDDFARMETPRIGSFASAGELTETTASDFAPVPTSAPSR
jgi:hypothetical protein